MDTPHHIAITICGDGGTGKSSIALRLVRSKWTSIYDPTIEDNYSVTRNIDGKTYDLSIKDTAGQAEYRSMWKASLPHSDAFLLVYDITDPGSFNLLEEFSMSIDQENEKRLKHWERTKSIQQENFRANSRQESYLDRRQIPMAKAVKIVTGNMCDLQQNRRVMARTGLEWARAHGCGFMETSARNKVNIEEILELIVRRVMQMRKFEMKGGPGGLRRRHTKEPSIHFMPTIDRPSSQDTTSNLLNPLEQQQEKEDLLKKTKSRPTRCIKWLWKLRYPCVWRRWPGCF